MPQIALAIHEDTPCPGCGYNLRGLRLDRRCPECGRPAADSFARPIHFLNGLFAESMILRPAGWCVTAALLGVMVRGTVTLTASPEPWLLPMAVLAALTGLCFAAVVLRDVRLLRRFRGSRPLRERAAVWRSLCVFSALVTASLPVWPIIVPEAPLVWACVYVAAAVPAVAAAVLGALAGKEMLERHSLPRTHPRAWLATAAGLALMASAPLVPLPGVALAGAGIAAAFTAGLVVWMVAAGRLISTLRRAQGPVISL